MQWGQCGADAILDKFYTVTNGQKNSRQKSRFGPGPNCNIKLTPTMGKNETKTHWWWVRLTKHCVTVTLTPILA